MYLRDKYKIKNSSDFYMVGGMGHTSSVALGYALFTKKKTICIDGYKFVTTQDIEYVGIGNSNSISTSVGTIQFMIVENGKMIPAKCN